MAMVDTVYWLPIGGPAVPADWLGPKIDGHLALGWPKKIFSLYAFIRTQHFDLPTGKPYVHKFEENQTIFRGVSE